MTTGPTRRPDDRQNTDIERGGDEEARTVRRDVDHKEGGERRVGPEDEDRRVRPGEKRPFGTMP